MTPQDLYFFVFFSFKLLHSGLGAVRGGVLGCIRGGVRGGVRGGDGV